MAELLSELYRNEEMLQDTPFCAEEVADAVKKLKAGKAPGPDRLLAEHLKWEGILCWCGCRVYVLNFIAESEAVSSVLKAGKAGIVMPVYKGGWKDPLKVDSFRGVTLMSTLAKGLEFLIVEQLQLLLLEAGLPHINQSAYQGGIPCAEAIFATQETIAWYMSGGNKVYMCLYDLEKIFDSCLSAPVVWHGDQCELGRLDLLSTTCMLGATFMLMTYGHLPVIWTCWIHRCCLFRGLQRRTS